MGVVPGSPFGTVLAGNSVPRALALSPLSEGPQPIPPREASTLVQQAVSLQLVWGSLDKGASDCGGAPALALPFLRDEWHTQADRGAAVVGSHTAGAPTDH